MRYSSKKMEEGPPPPSWRLPNGPPFQHTDCWHLHNVTCRCMSSHISVSSSGDKIAGLGSKFDIVNEHSPYSQLVWLKESTITSKSIFSPSYISSQSSGLGDRGKRVHLIESTCFPIAKIGPNRWANHSNNYLSPATTLDVTNARKWMGEG